MCFESFLSCLCYLEPANIFTLVWGKSAKYWSKNSCRTSSRLGAELLSRGASKLVRQSFMWCAVRSNLFGRKICCITFFSHETIMLNNFVFSTLIIWIHIFSSSSTSPPLTHPTPLPSPPFPIHRNRSYRGGRFGPRVWGAQKRSRASQAHQAYLRPPHTHYASTNLSLSIPLPLITSHSPSCK